MFLEPIEIKKQLKKPISTTSTELNELELKANEPCPFAAATDTKVEEIGLYKGEIVLDVYTCEIGKGPCFGGRVNNHGKEILLPCSLEYAEQHCDMYQENQKQVA